MGEVPRVTSQFLLLLLFVVVSVEAVINNSKKELTPGNKHKNLDKPGKVKNYFLNVSWSEGFFRF